jgi:hypothetical protein
MEEIGSTIALFSGDDSEELIAEGGETDAELFRT